MSKSRTGVDDTPVAPDSPGGWDARSEEALATRAPRLRTPEGGAKGGARKGVRRGAADPVKTLLHRHRDLCARAVDPLEIAAGLEAHGVTDRIAARYRHRDVFSLAEEMYARVPRDERAQAPEPEQEPEERSGAGWALLALLPGAVCAAAVAGHELTAGRARLAVLAVGMCAVALALRIALRHGPLRARGRTVSRTRACTAFLLLYALAGDGLLRDALAGGPDGPWPLDTAALLGLALAYAPAAWSARLFAVAARRRLARSRGLAEFAAKARPLLLAVVALYAVALSGLLALTGHLLGQSALPVGAALLGVLLLLARLSTSYGFVRGPALVLGVVCALEGLAVASVFAARLPGCDLLAVPVDTVGAGAVPVLACGAGAVVLLFRAARTLTRASAHAEAPGERR